MNIEYDDNDLPSPTRIVVRWAKSLAADGGDELEEWLNTELDKVASSEWKALLELAEELGDSKTRYNYFFSVKDELVKMRGNSLFLVDLTGVSWCHRIRNVDFVVGFFSRLPIRFISQILKREYDENIIKIDHEAGLILNRTIIQNIFNNPDLVFKESETTPKDPIVELHNYLIKGIQPLNESYLLKDIQEGLDRYYQTAENSMVDSKSYISLYLTSRDISNNYNKVADASYKNASQANWEQYLYKRASEQVGAEIPEDWLRVID